MTSKQLFISLFLLLIVTGCQPQSDNEQTLTSEAMACTKDAKICPDGQTVSRNPDLNCQFDPCPEPASEIECMEDMKQCPDGSFVRRDASLNCQFKPCPLANKEPDSPIFCTQDVAQCADGSYVGRDPKNNCQFKPCDDGSIPGRSKARLD
ncbi:MAG: hypothetical protein DWP95_07755 [Proteobacteria bacterium]|nr:MAG: hypothetical protein DWP95_07755 [Pseudomonadota bacterium]